MSTVHRTTSLVITTVKTKTNILINLPRPYNNIPLSDSTVIWSVGCNVPTTTNIERMAVERFKLMLNKI